MSGIFTFFIKNPVAANLLMFSIIILGIFSLQKNRVEFFPTLSVKTVVATVPWENSTTQEVLDYIIEPFRSVFDGISGVDKITSTASAGAAVFMISFNSNKDMDEAVTDVERVFSKQRSQLPEGIKDPRVETGSFEDRVMSVVLTHEHSSQLLIETARSAENDLLNLGANEINISGIPEHKISIELDPLKLQRLNLTSSDVYNAIRSQNKDISLGKVGNLDNPYNLKIQENKRSLEAFKNTIITQKGFNNILLRDIANIQDDYESEENLRVVYNSKPAIIIDILASETQDIIDISKKILQWKEDIKPTLDSAISIETTFERWRLIESRLTLVLKNAFTGLLLVTLILFFFVGRVVALWVMVGASVAFLGSLIVLYFFNQTINMISLFGFVLATGIVVDDAIVISEQIYSNHLRGKTASQAAIDGVKKISKPVFASAFTTVGAFFPLLFIGYEIGQILFVLPLVVISVLIFSLMESFLILPYHLKHSFQKNEQHSKNSATRIKDRAWFIWFKTKMADPLFSVCFRHPLKIILVILLVVVLALMAAKNIRFLFFPTPPGNEIIGGVRLLPSSTYEQRKLIENMIQETFENISSEYEANGIDSDIFTHLYTIGQDFDNIKIYSEIKDVAVRKFELSTLILDIQTALKKRFENIDFISRIYISEAQSGPPGGDIALILSDLDIVQLKDISLELQEKISAINGVSGVRDNTPLGLGDIVLKINERGKSLGLTVNNIIPQIKSSFSSHLVDDFIKNKDKTSIKIQLPKRIGGQITGLKTFQIRLPSGGYVGLEEIVNFKYQYFPKLINGINGKSSITIKGDVNKIIATPNEVNAFIINEIIPLVESKYPGVRFEFSGDAENQMKTFSDMKTGAILGLFLIYLVLALIFGRYFMPFTVLLSLVILLPGIVLGYLLLGYNFTLLTFMGIFGLLGIAINSTIIWVDSYLDHRKTQDSYTSALSASLARLRPILCTTATTVIGLVPMLFESSMQAQFLKPMALVLLSGLIFSVLMSLIFVPCLFVCSYNVKMLFFRFFKKTVS